MNLITVILIAVGVFSFGAGIGVDRLAIFMKKLGKTLFVCVNPDTRRVSIRYSKHKGAVADMVFADEVPKSVALKGNLAFNDGWHMAFLVDTVSGLAFDVVRAITGEPLAAHLDGGSLNQIRHDTRVTQIQASNAMNLAMILKFLVIGMALLLLAALAFGFFLVPKH